MQNLKIAIIGAGPAGCMLARLLHRGGITATIYEGETSATFRSQGGTLDLHTDSGLAAIKEAGLWDIFLSYARYDGEYAAIVDKNVNYHVVREAGSEANTTFGERPEIDRVKLREILLNSVPEGSVQWGHRLQKVEGRTLTFTNGTTADYDLIIGADGAFSKVRLSIAPELKPVYTGVGMQEMIIPDAEETAPEVYKFVNRGSIFASEDGQRFTLQQMGDGSISMGVCLVHEDPEWWKPEKCGYNVEDIGEVRVAMAKALKDWAPMYHRALEAAQGRTTPRPLWRLPVGGRWKHTPGITLIGDAAHLMTPHTGEGVNQALEDAMFLAQIIIKAQSAEELDQQIIAFESDMMARLEPIQQATIDRCNVLMFSKGLPQTLIDHIVKTRRAQLAKAGAEDLDEAERILVKAQQAAGNMNTAKA